jgi:transposase
VGTGWRASSTMTREKTTIQKLNDLIRRSKMPKWLHHFGPKKYTSWQHLKCLFLKEELGLSYRRLMPILSNFGIKKVPEMSTLKKFSKRLSQTYKNLLLFWSSRIKDCSVGAIDATGISRTNASHYFVKHILNGKIKKRHIKLSLYVDVKTRKILSARVRSKPRHDVKDVKYLVNNSPVIADTNLMDKGYDSKEVHDFFRQRGVCSIVPVRKGCTKNMYRKQMRDYFDYGQYWQRNIVEAVIGAVKRKYGGSVSTRHERTQKTQIYLRLVLHNLSCAIAQLFHLSRECIYRNSYIEIK